MKFNDSQKKWAMTGVLLATLGFNISPPKSMKSFTLLDMASSEEVKVDKITNERGVFKVVYRASGKDKTIAEVSQVYTEAGATAACDDCMSAIVLNKPIASKIDELNLFTARAMSNLGGPAAKAEVEVEKEEREEKPAREERGKSSRKTEVAKADKSKDKYAKLNKSLQDLAISCGDKEEGKAENMSCYSLGLASLFSDLESDEINDKTVLSFIDRRVMPLQTDLVLENRAKYYAYLKGTGEKPESTAEVLSKFEEFMMEIPEGHSKLQQDLINTTASIKAADLRFINSLKEKSATMSGLEKTELQKEIGWRIETNPTIDTELYSMSQRIGEVTMQQANKFAAGLQEAINKAYFSVGSQSTVVDAQGNTWVRADMAGRGYTQVGTTTNMGNAVVPQGIPTGTNFPQPIVPTAPMGTGTMQQIQTVPQTFVQPQAQYQPQMYQQQGFVNPRVQQQYGTTANQPGVINMNTVSNGGTNQPGVINMNTSNGTGRVGY